MQLNKVMGSANSLAFEAKTNKLIYLSVTVFLFKYYITKIWFFEYITCIILHIVIHANIKVNTSYTYLILVIFTSKIKMWKYFVNFRIVLFGKILEQYTQDIFSKDYQVHGYLRIY